MLQIFLREVSSVLTSNLFKMASLVSSMTSLRTNLYISVLLLATIDVLPKETKNCLKSEAKPQLWQKC